METSSREIKKLILVRGLPGSGKTTFAKFLMEYIDIFNLNTDEFGVFEIATDDCWDQPYTINGKFNSAGLGPAHLKCQETVENKMVFSTPVIIVHNTFTTESELEPYITLAKKYNYEVTTLIIENRHKNTSIHDVPKETIQKMKNRFSIKLG